MNESYEVLTSALTKHASTLGDLAGELQQMLETARGVSLTADAYGQVGQQFVTAMAELARAGQEALRTEADALETARKSMRDTVSAYEQQEATGVAGLRAVGDELAQVSVSGPHGTTGQAAAPDAPSKMDNLAVVPAADLVDPPKPPAQLWNLQAPDTAAQSVDPSGLPDPYDELTPDNQRSLRDALRERAEPIGGASPLSDRNAEAVLRGGPSGTMHKLAEPGVPGPAIRFDGVGGATRDVLSLNPNYVQSPLRLYEALQEGLPAAQRSREPFELFVQVPEDTSQQDLHEFMDRFGTARELIESGGGRLPGIEDATIFFRDPAGNDLGAVTRERLR